MAEKIRVFIDTNVFLDYIESRPVGAKEAKSLFMLAAIDDIELLVSDLTIANVKYCTRKTITLDKFYQTMKSLRELFTVVAVGQTAVDKALAIEASDFEDALQYYAAEQANADVLVTRNVKDFPFATMKVMEPKDFLNEIENS